MKELDDLLNCSISLDQIKDPVINEYGYSYSRTNIEEHYRLNARDPLTNQDVTNKILIENKFISNIINKINQNEAFVEADFICPLTKKIIKNPVITSAGVTYEQEALEKELEKNPNIDPLTKQVLVPIKTNLPNADRYFVINRLAATCIEEFKKNYPTKENQEIIPITVAPISSVMSESVQSEVQEIKKITTDLFKNSVPANSFNDPDLQNVKYNIIQDNKLLYISLKVGGSFLGAETKPALQISSYYFDAEEFEKLKNVLIQNNILINDIQKTTHPKFSMSEPSRHYCGLYVEGVENVNKVLKILNFTPENKANSKIGIHEQEIINNLLTGYSNNYSISTKRIEAITALQQQLQAFFSKKTVLLPKDYQALANIVQKTIDQVDKDHQTDSRFFSFFGVKSRLSQTLTNYLSTLKSNHKYYPNMLITGNNNSFNTRQF